MKIQSVCLYWIHVLFYPFFQLEAFESVLISVSALRYSFFVTFFILCFLSKWRFQVTSVLYIHSHMYTLIQHTHMVDSLACVRKYFVFIFDVNYWIASSRSRGRLRCPSFSHFSAYAYCLCFDVFVSSFIGEWPLKSFECRLSSTKYLDGSAQINQASGNGQGIFDQGSRGPFEICELFDVFWKRVQLWVTPRIIRSLSFNKRFRLVSVIQSWPWSCPCSPDPFPRDRIVVVDVVADRRRLNVVYATSGHKLHSISSWHFLDIGVNPSEIFVRMLNFRSDKSVRILVIRRYFPEFHHQIVFKFHWKDKTVTTHLAFIFLLQI